MRASVNATLSLPPASERTCSLCVASEIDTYASFDPSGEIVGQRSATRSVVTRDSAPDGSRIHKFAAPSRPRTK